MKRKLQLIVIALITVVICVFLVKNGRYFENLKTVNPLVILMLLALDLLSKVLAGMKIKYFSGTFNVKLTFKEWFGLSSIMTFYNMLFFKSGTFAVAAYLKYKKEFNYSRYVSFLGCDMALLTMASGLLGVAGVVFSGTYSGGWEVFLAGSVCLVIFPVLFFFIPERLLKGENKWKKKINGVLDGFHSAKKDRALILKLFLLNVLILGLFAVRYYIIFKMLGVVVNLAVCLIVSPVSFLIQIIGLIPSGYGIRELAIGALTDFYNIGFAPGAMVSIVDRVIMMGLFLILGPLFSYLLAMNKRIADAGTE